VTPKKRRKAGKSASLHREEKGGKPKEKKYPLWFSKLREGSGPVREPPPL